MITSAGGEVRAFVQQYLTCDLTIIGGGMAGVCCAITAARAGLKVVLVQDRPVLGGNASSEVRLWILGATSHMGNNNRWAREGGVIDEILVENLYRNPEGNPCLFDPLLLEKVHAEPNITLLLNTAMHDLDMADNQTIRRVRAFCPQNQTTYEIESPLYCDASGDGVLGFRAGAAFRMGAESREEFGELFAPPSARHELLGHSIYFYSRDTGRPVKFVPPVFALQDITAIPRYHSIRAEHNGCNFWWLEYGGTLDTIRESETIKWELWKIVYGVWNHIKNSGQFPQAENLTLEWVGAIPGKRESRRFEGDAILTQQDIVEQRHHEDVVAHGGWAIDLHPKEGVYSPESPCTQWHSKGIYGIPYRCYHSRNVPNLFLAGRIISASHVAFGSTRVMATCAAGAQAVAIAATLCREHNIRPRDVGGAVYIQELQRRLMRAGQHLPGKRLQDPHDLAQHATITASSSLHLQELPADSPPMPLNESWAMMLPMFAGPIPEMTFFTDVHCATTLEFQLRFSSRPDSHTPDAIQEVCTRPLEPGEMRPVQIKFRSTIDVPRYAFVCFMANPNVSLHRTTRRITGILSVSHRCNAAVAKSATQTPPQGSGIDTFEFWYPERRPGGQNFAFRLGAPIKAFDATNVADGVARPTNQPHAWVADLNDPSPELMLQWPAEKNISSIHLTFDTDFDHPMESLLMGHPESVIPFCVREFTISDSSGNQLHRCDDNHQTNRTVRFDPAVRTSAIRIQLRHPSREVPAALFSVRCYSDTPD